MTTNNESTYKTLNELLPLIQEAGYMFFGHYMNGEENADLIFNSGLDVEKKLYFLDMPTPENKEKYDRRNLQEPTLENLEYDLSHFENSKEIIILRLPIEFINFTGDRDHIIERYIPFTKTKIKNRKAIHYIEPKFIFGCYDVERKSVKLNENYEYEIKEDELKKGYQKALSFTKERLGR